MAGRFHFQRIYQNETLLPKVLIVFSFVPSSVAQDVIAGVGMDISHELINLEISSPHVPDLTLIDLPGITRVALGNQPADIGFQVKLRLHPALGLGGWVGHGGCIRAQMNSGLSLKGGYIRSVSGKFGEHGGCSLLGVSRRRLWREGGKQAKSEIRFVRFVFYTVTHLWLLSHLVLGSLLGTCGESSEH